MDPGSIWIQSSSGNLSNTMSAHTEKKSCKEIPTGTTCAYSFYGRLWRMGPGQVWGAITSTPEPAFHNLESGATLTSHVPSETQKGRHTWLIPVTSSSDSVPSLAPPLGANVWDKPQHPLFNSVVILLSLLTASVSIHMVSQISHNKKRPWCWERLKAKGNKGGRGWDGWMASPTQWTRIWASSRKEWRTREPGMLQSMGSQRVGRDLTTQWQWQKYEWSKDKIHDLQGLPKADLGMPRGCSGTCQPPSGQKLTSLSSKTTGMCSSLDSCPGRRAQARPKQGLFLSIQRATPAPSEQSGWNTNAPTWMHKLHWGVMSIPKQRGSKKYSLRRTPTTISHLGRMGRSLPLGGSTHTYRRHSGHHFNLSLLCRHSLEALGKPWKRLAVHCLVLIDAVFRILKAALSDHFCNLQPTPVLDTLGIPECSLLQPPINFTLC